MKVKFFCEKCRSFQEVNEIRLGLAGIRRQDIGFEIILGCEHRLFVRLNLQAIQAIFKEAKL